MNFHKYARLDIVVPILMITFMLSIDVYLITNTYGPSKPESKAYTYRRICISGDVYYRVKDEGKIFYLPSSSQSKCK